MAKAKKRGKYSLFRDEQIDAEHVAAMVDEKIAEIGQNLANLEDVEQRVALLENVCWCVAHNVKLKKVSETLGLKGDTGASRVFRIARAVEILGKRPPKGCATWPEAFEQYTVTALYALVKGGSRKPKTVAEEVVAAVKKVLKSITALEEDHDRRDGWRINGFTAWLAGSLATQTFNFDTLEVVTEDNVTLAAPEIAAATGTDG